MSDAEGVKALVDEIDIEMSKKSFKFFFTEILGFDYADHHEAWDNGLNGHRYYCVKASRDHGKSVFFMSYALWIAAFNPNTHVMVFSHSLEQTLEHMRFIRSNIDMADILKPLKPSGKPWAKSYFEFTNGSRIMASTLTWLCAMIFCGVQPYPNFNVQPIGSIPFCSLYCTTQVE